jgi:hypothetical protein
MSLLQRAPIEIDCNGDIRSMQIDLHETVREIRTRAIELFEIPPERGAGMALYFEGGEPIDENIAADGAGLKPNLKVFLQ